MPKDNKLRLFQNQSVRTHWDETQEKWYFSIIDVVAILTNQQNFQTARKYWNKLKERLKIEGNKTVSNCEFNNNKPSDHIFLKLEKIKELI